MFSQIWVGNVDFYIIDVFVLLFAETQDVSVKYKEGKIKIIDCVIRKIKIVKSGTSWESASIAFGSPKK
jgi:hypothetical protein